MIWKVLLLFGNLHEFFTGLRPRYRRVWSIVALADASTTEHEALIFGGREFLLEEPGSIMNSGIAEPSSTTQMI